MKTTSFCMKKFNSMLLSATIIMIVVIVLQISDLAIAGNIVGEDAIAAINVLRNPFMLVLGLCSIMSQGSSLLYSYKMGEFDKDGADKIFGQGLIGSLVLCVLILMLGLFGFDVYFNFVNASEQITALAKDFCVYYVPLLAVYPVYMYLAAMVYADGDEKLSLIANLFLILGNIVLSILFALKMGIAGISLGSLVGVATCMLVTAFHFFKKTNSLKFKFFVSLKSLWQVARFSFVDAGVYIYFAIQGLVITKLVVQRFGAENLAVYSIVVSIWLLTLIFDGVGQAFSPLVNVYRGEKNPLGVRRVMKGALKIACIEGVVMTALLFGFADFVPLAFDIETPALAKSFVRAVRLSCIGLTATSVLFLISSYFLLLAKIKHAVLICFFKDLLMPVAFALPFSAIWGMDGIWIGFSAGAVAALIASVAVTWLILGKNGFPLYLESSNGKIFCFDFYITVEEIMSHRELVAELLAQNNVSKRTIMRSMLLIEEVFMLIKEKNSGKLLMAEMTVFLEEDKVRIIMRDDGEIFNITDSDDAVISFRSFFVSSLMSDQGPRKNLTTMSFNRNMFVLPLNS